MRDDVLRSSGLYVGLCQAPEHVVGEEQTSASGLLTPVLAFAKPPTMSRRRVHDMKEKRVELETQ
jgi:hypothetical protein